MIIKNRSLSVSASSARTTPFEITVQPETTVETSSHTACQVFTIAAYADPLPQTPANHTSIGELVEQWGADDQMHTALEKGRRWVADSFYGEDGDTVRTLRLNAGWTQSRLAAMLGTSQSHVARIERGTENLTIETCRKLAKALNVDLNTLDQALKRQELVVRSRSK